MARLAHDRDTHLTPEEIAAEALRQFDADGPEPSIRSLAAALKVAPTAIYHHFPSRAAIVDATIDLVWGEAAQIGRELVPDLRAAEPAEVLVASAVAARRAFVAHPRVAAALAASQAAGRRLSENMALLAGAFDRLGMSSEEAAVAFHGYAALTVGSILFIAARSGPDGEAPQAARLPGGPQAETMAAMDDVRSLLTTDPARDEALFVQALRRLLGVGAGAGRSIAPLA